MLIETVWLSGLWHKNTFYRRKQCISCEAIASDAKYSWYLMSHNTVSHHKFTPICGYGYLRQISQQFSVIWIDEGNVNKLCLRSGDVKNECSRCKVNSAAVTGADWGIHIHTKALTCRTTSTHPHIWMLKNTQHDIHTYRRVPKRFLMPWSVWFPHKNTFRLHTAGRVQRRLTTKKKPMLIILAVRGKSWWANPLLSISCWETTSPTPTKEPEGETGARYCESTEHRHTRNIHTYMQKTILSRYLYFSYTRFWLTTMQCSCRTGWS